MSLFIFARDLLVAATSSYCICRKESILLFWRILQRDRNGSLSTRKNALLLTEPIRNTRQYTCLWGSIRAVELSSSH